MEDVKEKVETMTEDIPKRLAFTIFLDDIDNDAFLNGKKEDLNEIVSDLKKIGIELEIDMGFLTIKYDKWKEGIINWDDYPIIVPKEKVENVKMEETKVIHFEGDTPKRLGLVITLDEIDKDSLLVGLRKEDFKEMASDLRKIGIELRIDSRYLVLGYHKWKEGIINWDDYPIRVSEEKVKNMNMKGAGKVEQEMNKEEILNQDKEFKYKLLDRMRSDCEYYLNYGNKDAKYLWAGNEKQQIETMRAIYNSFSQNEKPEWITLEQIDGFEKEMLEMTKEQEINMEQENLNAVWEMQKMLESPIFNICEQGIRDKDILYKIAQQYNLSVNSTESISAAMENQIVQQAFENNLVVKNLSEKLKRYSGDTAFAPVQVDIENYFECKKGEIENALELYKNCVKSAFEAGFSIDNVYGAINNGVCVYDNREVDLVSYDGEAATLDDIYNKIEYYRNERDEREEKLEVIHIKELKSEIEELENSIEDTNICMQMGTEAVALVEGKITDKYTQLRYETTNFLENADSEKLNNLEFLESINVDEINGVYVQKTYSCGAWKASVDMDDILKMRRIKGLNSLEFKNCDIRSAVFSDNFENCKFENCSLFSCELTNAKFTNTTFQNVTFYQCVAQNIEFENCKFEKCHDDVPVVQTLKSENIKFVNTDIKDSWLNLEHADTNLDLKSVSLKNCSLENVDCYLTADGKYKNQSTTKKINSEQTLMKLLGRDLRKSLNKNTNSQEQSKDKKARIRRKGKSR